MVGFGCSNEFCVWLWRKCSDDGRKVYRARHGFIGAEQGRESSGSMG